VKAFDAGARARARSALTPIPWPEFLSPAVRAVFDELSVPVQAPGGWKESHGWSMTGHPPPVRQYTVSRRGLSGLRRGGQPWKARREGGHVADSADNIFSGRKAMTHQEDITSATAVPTQRTDLHQAVAELQQQVGELQHAAHVPETVGPAPTGVLIGAGSDPLML
jgi:hypothetical protein